MNELVKTEVMSAQEAQEQFIDLKKFITGQMVRDVDYGQIPGTNKPSLWKPGAEKLLFFHGLGAKLEATANTILKWEEPMFFNYEFKCSVYSKKTGNVYAEAIGSANSKETKFAYVWLPENKLPIGMEKEGLLSKRGQYGILYRVNNPEQANQVNTLLKIAQKRALVGAALIACRAGFFFGQEFEEEGVSQEPTIDKVKEVFGGEVKTTPIASTSSTNGSEVCITEKQAKLVYALIKNSSLSKDDVKRLFTDTLPYTIDEQGIHHISRIHKGDMDGLVKFLKAK